MGNPEDKEKRLKRRRRNEYAKELQQKQYKQKIVPPKDEYKRVRINTKNYDRFVDGD